MGIDQDLAISRLAREKAAALASADEFREYAAQLEVEITTVRVENCELRAAATLTLADSRAIVAHFDTLMPGVECSADLRAAIAKLRGKQS